MTVKNRVHHRPRSRQPEKVKSCRVCGCTELRACVTSDGSTCSWSMEADDICDFCMVTCAGVEVWIRLQAENGRNVKPLMERLLRMSAEIAVTTDDPPEEPKVELVGEAEANAYLRARGAAGGIA